MRIGTIGALVAGAFACLSVAGCHRAAPEPQPDPPSPGSSATDNRTEARATAKPAKPAASARRQQMPAISATFTPPASWKKADQPGPMRRETYVVPRAPGDPEDGDVSVSEAGGTVEDNVTRWARQFNLGPHDAKQTKKAIAGLNVTIVELQGEYTGMAMPGAGATPPAKKTGWAMRAAIIETSPPTFVKLTGPAKTVAKAAGDFDQMIASLTLRSVR